VASASAYDARGGAASCTAPGRVAGFVERARGYGAEILAGGSTPGDRGFFYQPSLVGGVAQDSEIVQKEVFGPVLTIQHFVAEL
jgi:betaine-aldehyde dehydrogenase